MPLLVRAGILNLPLRDGTIQFRDVPLPRFPLGTRHSQLSNPASMWARRPSVRPLAQLLVMEQV
jgi:hypothetical protein